MGVPINNVTRRVVFAASGTGPYSFTFEILAATDIAVYKDDTLLTLTTNYTVTINSNGTGSITLTAAPTGATQIAIVGNRTISRTTDFVTGGDFFANTLNDELDQQTIFAQQNAEGLQRALQAPQTDPTSINMTLPRAADRANKALGFDANGNPAIADTIGTNRGNWAASTLYYVRDIVKDTSTSNIWQCIVQHTSTGAQPISTNTDAAKWSLLVDAAAAGTSATNAATSATAAAASASAAATSASNAATSASNAATSESNASTSASSASTSASTATTQASNASAFATLASQWAQLTSGIVASTDYSAKEFAQGSQSSTGGSAKNWAQQTGGDVTGASANSRSAKAWAQESLTGATLGGSAKDWAQYTSSTVDGTNYSAKYHANAASSSATSAANSAALAAASAASGLYNAVIDKSANYTVALADNGDLIRVTTTSGAVTITLPQISTLVDGFKVAIVKWTGDTNGVTITRSGSDTINGAPTYTIGSQYTSATFVADFETNQWFATASGIGTTNAVVDRFSGNASTTAFTLSGDPGSLNNTYVFIGGVYQQKNTYSVSGTTLTFIAAPPTGTNNVEVVWVQPLAIGTPSDGTVSLVKFSATGTPSSSTYLRGDNTWATIPTPATGAQGFVTQTSAGDYGVISLQGAPANFGLI